MTIPRTPSRPSDAKLRKKLQTICDNAPGTIPASIAESALEHDDPAKFLLGSQLGKLLGFAEDGASLTITVKKTDSIN